MNFLANRCYNRPDRVVGLLSYKNLKPVRLGPVFNNIKYFASTCESQKAGATSSCGAAKGGKHRVTYKPYIPHCYKDHDQKNMGLNRPMSPHLTIFKMTTPAAMSIFQRITGIMLASYAILLATGSLFLSNGVETYVSIIQSLNLGSSSVFILKCLLGAPFAFHYFNGIRFCIWNTGRMLAMNEVASSATKTILGTIILTLFFAFV